MGLYAVLELIRDIKYMWFVYRENRITAVPLIALGGLLYWVVLVIEATTGKRMSVRESKSELCGGCNMRVILVELSKERDCHKCGKKIAVGEKAIKTVARSSSCSATEIYSVYVHELCWKPGVGKK